MSHVPTSIKFPAKVSAEEMQQLADAMAAQFERLKFGGRAVVITFKPREVCIVPQCLDSMTRISTGTVLHVRHLFVLRLDMYL